MIMTNKICREYFILNNIFLFYMIDRECNMYNSNLYIEFLCDFISTLRIIPYKFYAFDCVYERIRGKLNKRMGRIFEAR